MTIQWLSNDFRMTIQWLSDDYRMTIWWLSDDNSMTIQWLSDDYHMTIQWLLMTIDDSPMTIRWLSDDYWWLPMTIQWLSDDYPLTIRWLSDDYPMTIWWLSRAFDLFFLMIIDLKRSIDRRWLFKSGATFILRWSCYSPSSAAQSVGSFLVSIALILGDMPAELGSIAEKVPKLAIV